MNIHQLSSYIYNHTADAIDTEVVDGYCPDDTVKIWAGEDRNIYIALGFDPDDDHFILGALHAVDGGYDEPVEEGLCWHVEDDEDYETLDTLCKDVEKRLTGWNA